MATKSIDEEQAENLKRIMKYKWITALEVILPPVVLALLLILSASCSMNFNLNRAGLVLNMIGVTLSFFFPLPFADEEGIVMGLEDGTRLDGATISVGEFNSTVEDVKKWRRYSSSLGFIWLGLGFFLQFFG